jgi:hypothetical protein
VRRAQRLETSGREGAVSARQSADLEGLSQVEQADSESVDELVEEGNVFEAGAVRVWRKQTIKIRGKCTPMRFLKTMFPMSIWRRIS